MSERPDLTHSLSADAFLDYYWLREELAAFCRNVGLSSAGSKIVITDRIAHFLRTGEKLPPQPARKRGVMPKTFTRDSVIGPGWRCSQDLRKFFQSEIGKGFGFNGVMRDFISQGEGKTLAHAIAAYEMDKADTSKKPIEGQFEYNRFTRAYYKNRPNALRSDVIAAWVVHRDTPKSKR